MRIYESIRKFEQLPRAAVVTLGTFDGVHMGHQALLKVLRSRADQLGGDTVLVTFWPHPRIVLVHTHAKPIRLLTTFEEKAVILAQYGIDHLLKLPFSKTFAQSSPSAFIKEVLLPIGGQELVVGYNHRFGKDRAGDVALLQQAGEEYGFGVETVAPAMINDVAISSTKVRQRLQAGDLAQANTYLGRPYAMSCAVLQSKPAPQGSGLQVQLAAQATHKLIPALGVYKASIMREDGPYAGDLYIKRDVMLLHLPQLEGKLIDHGWDVKLHERIS